VRERRASAPPFYEKNKEMKNKKKFHHARKETVLVAVLVFLVLVVMLKLAPWRKPKVTEVAKVAEVAAVRRGLDGVLVEPGKEKSPFAGVMVENMVEAQPISGLADANLVFEALTEANITRFLAYFVLPPPPPQSSPIKVEEVDGNPPPPVGGARGGGDIEIGPVRSARPYYLDWASEFDTLYGHVGSSPVAYDMLRKQGVEGVHDLDQWYKSEYFRRVTSRPAPHNVLTSSELLRKAYDDIFGSSASAAAEAELPNIDPWKFKGDASPDVRGNVSDIKIGYAAPYNVEWLYDKARNSYTRMQWGGVHKDAQGREIVTKNIAVAFEEMKVLDDLGRKQFTTIGEGKGLVFQDGRVSVGTWKKPSARERMRFYDAQGNEIEFNGGTTWIEIVPTGYNVSY